MTATMGEMAMVLSTPPTPCTGVVPDEVHGPNEHFLRTTWNRTERETNIIKRELAIRFRG